MTEETPVLIAGAGPTGLALAATRSPSCRHDASSPGAAARDTARWPVPWYGLAATGSATMSTTSTTDLADYVIATVRAHEAELRRAGVRHLSLFGSVARGEAADESDVDLLVELDPRHSRPPPRLGQTSRTAT